MWIISAQISFLLFDGYHLGHNPGNWIVAEPPAQNKGVAVAKGHSSSTNNYSCTLWNSTEVDLQDLLTRMLYYLFQVYKHICFLFMQTFCCFLTPQLLNKQNCLVKNIHKKNIYFSQVFKWGINCLNYLQVDTSYM